MKDVKLLFDHTIKEVTPENWWKAVQHVIKQEEKMWNLDNLIDQTVDPLIIILSRGDDSSSDDEEYNLL